MHHSKIQIFRKFFLNLIKYFNKFFKLFLQPKYSRLYQTDYRNISELVWRSRSFLFGFFNVWSNKKFNSYFCGHHFNIDIHQRIAISIDYKRNSIAFRKCQKHPIQLNARTDQERNRFVKHIWFSVRHFSHSTGIILLH